MKFTQFSNQKVMLALVLFQEIRGGNNNTDADNVAVERYEPGPMKLFLIENQRIVGMGIARATVFAAGAGNLGEDRNLLIVSTQVFRASNPAQIRKPRRLPG